MKKTVLVALALLGVAIASAATIGFGARHVLAALGAAGWRGFGVLVLWQIALFAVLGGAWATVCPGASPAATFWGRLVREGGTNCLPFSEIGGLVLGARALVLCGVRFERAAVSTAADIAAEAIAEAPFVAFGVMMLATRRPGSSLVIPGVAGLVLAGAIGIGVIVLSRRTALLRRVGHRIARSSFPSRADEVDRLGDEAEHLFGRSLSLSLASFLHLLGWIGGGISVFIAYRAIGVHATLPSSIAIEALLSGALSIAFVVPAGLGVQELSYVGIGALFGMPAGDSLALSFLRRGRDLAIGVPPLLAWQLIEARQLRANATRS